MSPSIIIGKFQRQLKWAHPSPSVCFKGSSYGPIGHWQLSKAAEMGPFKVIGRIQWLLRWAHPSSSTTIGYLFLAENEYCHFSAIMVFDHEDEATSLQHQEFGDEV